MPDGEDAEKVKRRGRPRKTTNLTGKKLFEEQVSSEDEDSVSVSEHEDRGEEDDEDQPLIQSMTSKLRSMKVQRRETKGSSRTPRS